MSPNKWLLFLEYAKEHPQTVPKSQKLRSEMYHKFIDHCKCNSKPEVCRRMGITSLKSTKTKSYDPDNDPVMLRAKIKAYEEIVDNKDKYIEELEAFLHKSNKTRKTA